MWPPQSAAQGRRVRWSSQSRRQGQAGMTRPVEQMIADINPLKPLDHGRHEAKSSTHGSDGAGLP